MAQDVAELIHFLDIETPIIVGHSMGGKVAMALSFAKSEDIKGLIVVDIAPKKYKHSNISLITAMTKANLDEISSRVEADKLFSKHIHNSELRAFVLQNLILENGVASWRINLASILSNLKFLMDFPYRKNEFFFKGPVLFIGGGASEYMQGIKLDNLFDFFPSAELKIIKNAGHWVHAKEPGLFYQIASQFLDKTQKKGTA